MHKIHYLYSPCKNEYGLKLKEIENQMNSFFKQKTIYPIPLINGDVINLNKHKYEIIKKMIEDSKKVLSESNIVIKINKEREPRMKNEIYFSESQGFYGGNQYQEASIEFTKINEVEYMITKFNNLLTSEEIIKKYGFLVYEKYTNSPARMCLTKSKEKLQMLYLVYNNDKIILNNKYYSLGTKLLNSDMNEFIKKCKEAGKAFTEIVKEVNNMKTEKVKI